MGLTDKGSVKMEAPLAVLQRRIEEAENELREQERLLGALQRIGEVTLSSLDRDEVVENLAAEIVDAGIFRSLMVALVDAQERCVEIKQGFYLDRDGRRVTVADKIGVRYGLDDANITAEVARTGELTVIEGWDDRYDRRFASPETMQRHVTYFIPVRKGDQVLAVLATGSAKRDKESTLQRIEIMQPLLNQVAIALEHAALYAAARDQARQLARLERMRVIGEMAAGISHNLNNLLVGILMPAQALSEMLTEPELRAEAEDINAAALRAADLVRRLNESVRGTEEDARPVQLAAVVGEAVQATRSRWRDAVALEGRSIEVVTEIAETPPVRGTETGIYEALVNLIFNAVDAMPRGGRISIDVRSAGTGVLLTVRDNGTGMDEATRRRVFEPFFTTKADVGTGLGLSTVYGAVTRWGGGIDVSSAPGEGTCFTLRLPVWDPSLPSGD